MHFRDYLNLKFNEAKSEDDYGSDPFGRPGEKHHAMDVKVPLSDKSWDEIGELTGQERRLEMEFMRALDQLAREYARNNNMPEWGKNEYPPVEALRKVKPKDVNDWLVRTGNPMILKGKGTKSQNGNMEKTIIRKIRDTKNRFINNIKSNPQGIDKMHPLGMRPDTSDYTYSAIKRNEFPDEKKQNAEERYQRYLNQVDDFNQEDPMDLLSKYPINTQEIMQDLMAKSGSNISPEQQQMLQRQAIEIASNPRKRMEFLYQKYFPQMHTYPDEPYHASRMKGESFKGFMHESMLEDLVWTLLEVGEEHRSDAMKQEVPDEVWDDFSKEMKSQSREHFALVRPIIDAVNRYANDQGISTLDAAKMLAKDKSFINSVNSQINSQGLEGNFKSKIAARLKSLSQGKDIMDFQPAAIKPLIQGLRNKNVLKGFDPSQSKAKRPKDPAYGTTQKQFKRWLGDKDAPKNQPTIPDWEKGLAELPDDMSREELEKYYDKFPHLLTIADKRDYHNKIKGDENPELQDMSNYLNKIYFSPTNQLNPNEVAEKEKLMTNVYNAAMKAAAYATRKYPNAYLDEEFMDFAMNRIVNKFQTRDLQSLQDAYASGDEDAIQKIMTSWGIQGTESAVKNLASKPQYQSGMDDFQMDTQFSTPGDSFSDYYGSQTDYSDDDYR